jgi:hypothetical protein
MDDTNKNLIGKAIGATIDPRYSLALALAGVARHYVGGPVATIAGGIAGYLIGSQTSITVEAKRAMISDVMTRRPDPALSGVSDSDERAGAPGILNSADLINYTYDRYNFTGKWHDFVGDPSINFHAMVFGRPKQGKSIMSFTWAKYLSENFGRVLYVASEEGFSVTLQKKAIEFASDNRNLDFANFRDFSQIRDAVQEGNYKFVFIDSVNYIRITPDDVEEIKAENPKTAFITIQQATKDGKFRGSQEFAHNCDMVIRVEAGVAHHQGRFQEGTEMQIFESKEEKAKKESGGPMLGDSALENVDQISYSDGGQLELFGSASY